MLSFEINDSRSNDDFYFYIAQRHNKVTQLHLLPREHDSILIRFFSLSHQSSRTSKRKSQRCRCIRPLKTWWLTRTLRSGLISVIEHSHSSWSFKPGTKASTGSTTPKYIQQWVNNDASHDRHHAISSSKPSLIRIEQIMRV